MQITWATYDLSGLYPPASSHLKFQYAKPTLPLWLAPNQKTPPAQNPFMGPPKGDTLKFPDSSVDSATTWAPFLFKLNL